MADSSELLRMLEPMVRPVPTQPSRTNAAPTPIEHRSFDDLLNEAQSLMDDTDAAELAQQPVKPSKPSAGPLGPLARVDAIENVALRALIGRTGGATSDATAEATDAREDFS